MPWLWLVNYLATLTKGIPLDIFTVSSSPVLGFVTFEKNGGEPLYFRSDILCVGAFEFNTL